MAAPVTKPPPVRPGRSSDGGNGRGDSRGMRVERDGRGRRETEGGGSGAPSSDGHVDLQPQSEMDAGPDAFRTALATTGITAGLTLGNTGK